MSARTIGLLLGAMGTCALGAVVTYEGTSFPEKEGWQPNPFCEPDRLIRDGWFVQPVGPCRGIRPPGGQQESFTRSLDEFVGAPTFFLEWRMHTDGDSSEIPWTAPASFVAGSFGVTNYHFTIARDQVRFIRDNLLPILFVDIDPDLPHTYRLELYGDRLYAWYIDNELIDSGEPEGAYPSSTPVIQFRAKFWFFESTTKWDYVRYGDIPEDGSGDYDSDGSVDEDDYYFVHECLAASGPGVDAGPGCAFADMDADGDVDLRDLAAFQNAFTLDD